MIPPEATGCVIPAYSVTSDEVARILRAVHPLLGLAVVVVNDNRRTISRRQIEDYPAHVEIIDMGWPVGKAAAVRRGLKHLLKQEWIEAVIQVDGHLKQAPEQVAALVPSLDDVDLATAERYGFQNLSSQPHRQAVTTLFSRIVRLLSGVDLEDVFCGTRVYTREMATMFAQGTSYGYGLELEQLIRAGASGARVRGIAVHSNAQADCTAVEKIEENLAVLLMLVDSQSRPDVTDFLSHLMWRVKARADFIVNLGVIGMSGELEARFTREGEDGEEAFAFELSGCRSVDA